MKYCVVIIDGAAGWPLPERDNLTCLELAKTPNLDAMAREARLGLARTVPPGMEPSSAIACMSVIGYNPEVYYRGRSAIEAISMNIPIAEDEVVFRCNLVAIRDGKMFSYSSGSIGTEDAHQLIVALDKQLGNENIRFYPGVNYRHILKLKGQGQTLEAKCTPPHDITNRPVAEYLPQGAGSDFLRDLMKRSEDVLSDHPVNIARQNRGEIPATSIWLFWGSGKIPNTPAFDKVFGVKAAMTSAVDLLRGLGKMTDMTLLDIPGVTDNLNNDFAGQANGGLQALKQHDMVVYHIEAPDEAAHEGSIEKKILAIEKIDSEVISRIREYNDDKLRVLVMPDHPTPIKIQTHDAGPVPFMLWGAGIKSNGALRFSEKEAGKTGAMVDKGYTLMNNLVTEG
ncbi:MAG: cofactor-independent phosphoglycerate mutase [Dehalococcoidales bacterium]|nr:cofactor-independent phosphoglycerate mutase [Dehalococcoidales bacterium]